MTDGDVVTEGASVPASGTGLWRAAPVQEDLWVFEEIAGPSLAYTVIRSVDITGRLDVPALASALGRLADRHLLLRCTGGIAPPMDGVWMRDIGAGPLLEQADGDSNERCAAIARAVAGSVSLEDRPAWRAILLRWAEDARTLVMLFHHALIDGPSAETALADLIALYAAETGEPELALPPVTGDYRAFALAQHSAAARPHPADLAFWRRHLSGLRPPPGLTGALTATSHQRTVTQVRLPARCTAMTARAAAAAGVTEFTVCLAAVVSSLARSFDLDEVTVAAGTSRRPPSDNSIGAYVDVLPLRFPAARRATADLIPAVFDVLVAGLDHAGVPYRRVRREIAAPPGGGETLLTAFSVTMHAVNVVARQLGQSAWQPHDTASAYSPYPLHVAFQRGQDGLALFIGHDPEAFRAETAARLGDSIARALAELGEPAHGCT